MRTMSPLARSARGVQKATTQANLCTRRGRWFGLLLSLCYCQFSGVLKHSSNCILAAGPYRSLSVLTSCTRTLGPHHALAKGN